MRRHIAVLLAVLAGPAGAEDLRGHGGPVGALAARGDEVLSGSFDTRAILWDDAARRVLRFHDGNVTAVAFLADGFATGGQDGRIAIWGPDGTEPVQVHALHQAPVAALSPGADGLASAGWDGLVGLVANGGARSFMAHQGGVTGLGHLPDGALVTVGNDLRLRLWQGDAVRATVDLPAQPNGMAISGAEVAVISADGALRLVAPAAGVLRERFLADRPLIAVAAGGGRLAASGIDGRVWLLEADGTAPPREISPDQGPVWSLALEGDVLLTGGADGAIRRWNAATGAPLGGTGVAVLASVDDGSRGAEVWRACAVCHSVTPDDGNRAGPTLHGIFGRRIGTAPGYDYSDALRRMEIVWTPQTVAELFEHGPEAYTPGSRMPDQRVPDAEDRAALVAFLERVTR